MHSFSESSKLLHVNTLKQFAPALAPKINQSSPSLQLSFPSYMQKQTPVTPQSPFIHPTLKYHLHFHQNHTSTSHLPSHPHLTTLCPSSKQISQ
ncbi:GTP cyclohydrolase, FolE2/MptA family, partial [Bacillus sp. WP8]|uniref:GTP cyclohydrolase, FolE2/MptA family n=1 Tax=Bacillus sp. WP8 TaxID=756828 RepID=UPI0037C0F49C